MPFRLPPLNSLRIFEAAARHGNFSHAARELNLTPSAVSHAMQLLEEWLGTALFLRGPRGLRLSLAGNAYLPVVANALRELATASEQLPGRKPAGRLAISSAYTFARRFLLPRLGDFNRRFPEIKLTVDTSRQSADLPLDGFDAAIRMAPLDAGLPHWTLLFEESLVPVCSPGLRAASAKSPAEIFESGNLIHVTSVTSDWDTWFRASGIPSPGCQNAALRVDTIEMAFEAAARGLGVAIGREPLVGADIASGRLVAAAEVTVPSGSGYWLVAAEANFQKPGVKKLRGWLLDEARALTFGMPAQPAACGKTHKASRGNST